MVQKTAQRHLQLKVRINDREREVFERAAMIAGLTLSAWVRMVLREKMAAAIVSADAPTPGSPMSLAPNAKGR